MAKERKTFALGLFLSDESVHVIVSFRLSYLSTAHRINRRGHSFVFIIAAICCLE